MPSSPSPAPDHSAQLPLEMRSPRTRPMATCNACLYPSEHARKDWNQLVELLRKPASEAGYTGPDFTIIERLGELIDQVHNHIVDWTFATAQDFPGKYPMRAYRHRARE